MIISTTDIISNRDWWTYGNVKKYLRPVKEVNMEYFYDIIDVQMVEKMEKIGVLRRRIPLSSLKKGGEQYRIENIMNLIKIHIPYEVNVNNVKKEIKQYERKIRNRHKNHKPSKNKNITHSDILSHLRHNYTNYETIIYDKIDDIIEITKIDKNNLVKKLKKKINLYLIKKCKAWKGGSIWKTKRKKQKSKK